MTSRAEYLADLIAEQGPAPLQPLARVLPVVASKGDRAVIESVTRAITAVMIERSYDAGTLMVFADLAADAVTAGDLDAAEARDLLGWIGEQIDEIHALHRADLAEKRSNLSPADRRAHSCFECRINDNLHEARIILNGLGVALTEEGTCSADPDHRDHRRTLERSIAAAASQIHDYLRDHDLYEPTGCGHPDAEPDVDWMA